MDGGDCGGDAVSGRDRTGHHSVAPPDWCGVWRHCWVGSGTRLPETATRTAPTVLGASDPQFPGIDRAAWAGGAVGRRLAGVERAGVSLVAYPSRWRDRPDPIAGRAGTNSGQYARAPRRGVAALGCGRGHQPRIAGALGCALDVCAGGRGGADQQPRGTGAPTRRLVAERVFWRAQCGRQPLCRADLDRERHVCPTARPSADLPHGCRGGLLAWAASTKAHLTP